MFRARATLFSRAIGRLPGNTLATAVGDSRTAQLAQNTTSWSHNAAGQHLATALSGGRIRLPFANVFGGSGETPATIRSTRYPSGKATAARILILLAGVNQGTSLAQDIADVTYMVTDWVASSSDRIVIVYDEMPTDSGAGWDATKKARHAALRDAIRALNNPNAGIYVFGSWRIATGGNDGDTPVSGFYMSDGLHPIAKGSLLLGRGLTSSSIMKAIPSFNPYAGLTFAPGVTLDGANFLGTTGDALSVASLTTTNVVSSRMVVDGPITWAELTLNATVPQINPNYAGMPVGITAGVTTVSAIALVKVHAGTTGLRTLQLTPIKQSAGSLGTTTYLDMQNRGSAANDGPIVADTDLYFYLRTPPFVVDGTATQARWILYPSCDYVSTVAQTIVGKVSVARTGLVIGG